MQYLLSLALFFFLTAAANTGCSTPLHTPKVESLNETIALFPLENFSEDRRAAPLVMTLVRRQLEERGLTVLNEKDLNDFLLKERVRSTAYISKELAHKLNKAFNVKAVFLGSINSFGGGENPVAGLSARLVDSADGLILWADCASATGEDFTGLLGLGRIGSLEKLVPVVVDRLLEAFSTRPPVKEPEASYRIAVMPFQNKSKAMFAGMITTYMTLVELFKSKKFIPVEYGEIRKSIVDLRVRQKGELDYRNIEALSEVLAIDVVLVGTAEVYSAGPTPSVPPEAAVSMRLIDARGKKILWYGSSQMGGDDDIIVLDRGKMRSADKVAYKVITRLINKMGSSL